MFIKTITVVMLRENMKTINKLIFLDVDGVLNNAETKARTPSGFTGIMDSKVELLKKIVDETAAKIVLSSDWRLMEIDNPDYIYLNKKLSKYNLNIYSKTPDINWRDRGDEIATWLDVYGADAWVAIDDIFMLFETLPSEVFDNHVIITDEKYGLRDLDVKRAIEILNGENM